MTELKDFLIDILKCFSFEQIKKLPFKKGVFFIKILEFMICEQYFSNEVLLTVVKMLHLEHRSSSL